MTIPDTELCLAVAHLRKADRVIRKVIDRVGPCELALSNDRFGALVSSILSQQISGAAARTIHGRLRERIAPARVTAASIGSLSKDEMRTLGISNQKATYLLDLSAHVLENRLALSRVGRLSDEEVIRQLTAVKGIGVWTAQMFLMFSLGRLDVFPDQDLGVRNAIRNLYKLDELPDRETAHRIATPWRPYATIASWYCWRSLEQ